VTAVIDKYTESLKERTFDTKREELLSTFQYEYEKPPLLEVNSINLKMTLVEIAGEFDITGNLEVDNGHSFTYQIQVFFPQ
jgi:hypothetical protein